MTPATYPFTHPVGVTLRVPADADGSVVVALHGMGATGEAFSREALEFVPPRSAVLTPDGPYPIEVRRDDGSGLPPRQGNIWYVWTGDTPEFRESLERVEAWLLGVVAAETTAAGLDPRRTALVGYSQGAFLAGFVGVRNPSRFRALVVASGRVKDEFLADSAPAAAAAGLRVLAVHGTRDEFVPPQACRPSLDRLAAWGVAAEFRTYDTGHAVLRDPRCRTDVREFLARGLA